MPRPMGNIIAVAAVLLIHMEMTAVAAPSAIITRDGRDPTQDDVSIHAATRLSTPWTAMASANKKLPMNKKMMGCPYEAKRVLAVPNPAKTQHAVPRSAVTGSGIGSMIQ